MANLTQHIDATLTVFYTNTLSFATHCKGKNRSTANESSNKTHRATHFRYS